MGNWHDAAQAGVRLAVGLFGVRSAYRLALVSTVSAIALGVGAARAQEPAPEASETGQEAPAPAAPEAGARWSAHGSATVKAGAERSIGELDLFVPLLQGDSSMLFGDLRMQTDDSGNQEYNAGLGFRRMGENWVVGGYGFYDYRKSDETGNTFSQGTFGVEALSDALELRANGYLPEGGEQVAANATLVELVGTSLQMRLGSERALPGFDAEIGYGLWNSKDDNRELRFFLGGYHFDAADFDTVAGSRGRLEMRMFDLDALGEGSRFTLGAEITHDNVRDAQGFALARLTIPFGGGRRSGRGGLERRMVDYVVRDVDIITGTSASAPEAVNYADTGAAVGTVTVVSADANTLAAGGAASGLVIIDGAIDTTGSIALADNARLIGGGGGLVVVGVDSGTQMTYRAAGARGVINGTVDGGAVVTMASNTIVADLDINNLSTVKLSEGIRSTGTGASITGNFITTVAEEGHAVHLSGADSNIVDGNIMTTSGLRARGALLDTSADSNTVSNNSIFGSGPNADGIGVADSTLNTIIGNEITMTGGQGSGVTVAGGSANDVIGNIISTATDTSYGIFVFNTTGNTVSDNEIVTQGAGASGVDLFFASGNSGTGNTYSGLADGCTTSGGTNPIDVILDGGTTVSC